MPADIRRIEHIVIVLMENRSFDHVLGYLSRPGGRPEVDGIGDDAWRAAHANPGAGASLAPFALNIEVIPDPPHERDTIAMQIGTAGTPDTMRGFVQSYASRQPPPDDVSLVMGYYIIWPRTSRSRISSPRSTPFAIAGSQPYRPGRSRIGSWR